MQIDWVSDKQTMDPLDRGPWTNPDIYMTNLLGGGNYRCKACTTTGLHIGRLVVGHAHRVGRPRNYIGHHGGVGRRRRRRVGLWCDDTLLSGRRTVVLSVALRPSRTRHHVRRYLAIHTQWNFTLKSQNRHVDIIRGVATGIYRYYTLPKSGQVNFLCSNNDVRTVIELIPQWVLILYLTKNFYTSPKQIPGYAPGYHFTFNLG